MENTNEHSQIILPPCESLSLNEKASTTEEQLREKARKVWISFGVFMIMLPFMDEYQIICL